MRPRSCSSTSSTRSAPRGWEEAFHREHDQTLNQLFVELDGFNARDECRRDGSVQPAARTSTRLC